MVKRAERFQDYEYDHEAETRYCGGMAGRILGVVAIFALATLVTGLVLKHQTVMISGGGTFFVLLLISYTFMHRKPHCSHCGKPMLYATLPVTKETRSWLYDNVLSDDEETYTSRTGTTAGGGAGPRTYYRVRIQLFHCRSCKTMFVAQKRSLQKVEGGEDGIERQKNFRKKIDKLKHDGKLRPPGRE